MTSSKGKREHETAAPDIPPPPAQSADPIAEGLRAGKECLAEALNYQARGWSPLACCPPDHLGIGKEHGRTCKTPGKRPWHYWTAYQTRRPTENDIHIWWKSHANSNVGIALGPVSGLVRVDIDGEHGASRFRQLSGGDPPPTLEFTSGGGGRGLLFAIPDGAVIRTTSHSGEALHDELRIQAQGAQTVLPPSRHTSGRRYAWLPGRGPDEIEAAPMPAWMVEMMQVRTRPKREPRKGKDRQTDATYIEELLAALHVERAADYDTWLKVGMILHSVGDGDEMLDTWERWSQQSDRWEEGACAAKWDSFNSELERRSGPVTVGTLVFLAKQDGFRPRFTSLRPSPNGQTPHTDAASKETTPPPPGSGGTVPLSAAQPTGVQIILDYLRSRYCPLFRRGNAVVCADGREVFMTETCAVPDSPLIERLATAVDAPKHRGDPPSVNRDALPSFFNKWAKVAWGDLLSALPDEDDAEIGGAEPIRDEFRQLVADAMLSEIVLEDTIGHTGVTHTERRSLIDWCTKFAKVGPWRVIRSKRCWCKLVERSGGELLLKVAIRHELFAQVRADRRLVVMGEKRFTRRAVRDSIGTSSREERPHGLSAVVLADDFVAELTAGLDDGEDSVKETT